MNEIFWRNQTNIIPSILPNTLPTQPPVSLYPFSSRAWEDSQALQLITASPPRLMPYFRSPQNVSAHFSGSLPSVRREDSGLGAALSMASMALGIIFINSREERVFVSLPYTEPTPPAVSPSEDPLEQLARHLNAADFEALRRFNFEDLFARYTPETNREGYLRAVFLTHSAARLDIESACIALGLREDIISSVRNGVSEMADSSQRRRFWAQWVNLAGYFSDIRLREASDRQREDSLRVMRAFNLDPSTLDFDAIDPDVLIQMLFADNTSAKAFIASQVEALRASGEVAERRARVDFFENHRMVFSARERPRIQFPREVMRSINPPSPAPVLDLDAEQLRQRMRVVMRDPRTVRIPVETASGQPMMLVITPPAPMTFAYPIPLTYDTERSRRVFLLSDFESARGDVNTALFYYRNFPSGTGNLRSRLMPAQILLSAHAGDGDHPRDVIFETLMGIRLEPEIAEEISGASRALINIELNIVSDLAMLGNRSAREVILRMPFARLRPLNSLHTMVNFTARQQETYCAIPLRLLLDAAYLENVQAQAVIRDLDMNSWVAQVSELAETARRNNQRTTYLLRQTVADVILYQMSHGSSLERDVLEGQLRSVVVDPGDVLRLQDPVALRNVIYSFARPYDAANADREPGFASRDLVQIETSELALMAEVFREIFQSPESPQIPAYRSVLAVLEGEHLPRTIDMLRHVSLPILLEIHRRFYRSESRVPLRAQLTRAIAEQIDQRSVLTDSVRTYARACLAADQSESERPPIPEALRIEVTRFSNQFQTSFRGGGHSGGTNIYREPVLPRSRAEEPGDFFWLDPLRYLEEGRFIP